MSEPTWQRALITGASSGIGECFARKLAVRGTNLVLVARRGDRLDKLAEELRSSHGVEVEVIAADLTDDTQRGEVEKRLSDESNEVDLLINNAGFGSFGRFTDLPLDAEDRMVRLNMLTVLRLTHAALPNMLANGRGGILNVASLAGFQPAPGNATYSASKAFVISFTESVAEEVRGTGVKVSALCPGFTRTEFQEASVGDSLRKVPGFVWMSAESVAEFGLDAVTHGKVVAVPGIGYQIAGVASRLMPRALLRRAGGLVVRRL